MRLTVRRSILPALLVGATLGWNPLHAQDPVAIELYQRPLLGPYLRSEASVGVRTRLPDPESGCSITRSGWTWPLCRPVTGNAVDQAVSMTGAEVRARVGFPDSPYRTTQICGAVVNLFFNECGTMAGAVASSAYTGIRAHAEARQGESFTLTMPDLETPELTDDIEVDYGFFPDARATGEWTNEFTSDFSDWLELNMGVEMHERLGDPVINNLLDPLSLGRGRLLFGLFRKPPGLVPPPLCPVGPGVSGCGEGWSWYGLGVEEDETAVDLYGWDFVGGDNVGIRSIGLTPITFGFMAEAGATYSLVMRFTARARNNEYADFWGTAKLNYFEVPEGGSLSFAEGDFEVRERRAGGPPAVPEPASVWLLLGGVLGLVLIPRRRVGSVSRAQMDRHAA